MSHGIVGLFPTIFGLHLLTKQNDIMTQNLHIKGITVAQRWRE